MSSLLHNSFRGEPTSGKHVILNQMYDKKANDISS